MAVPGKSAQVKCEARLAPAEWDFDNHASSFL